MEIYDIAKYITSKYPDCWLNRNMELYEEDFDKSFLNDFLINDLMIFFSHEKLKLCGCGYPEYTEEAIRKLLNIRKDSFELNLSFEQEKDRYKTDLDLDINNKLHYGLLLFMLYELNDKGFLEHGFSITNCKLTNEGKMYLEVLNKWHKASC